jgi:hypothetical protein
MTLLAFESGNARPLAVRYGLRLPAIIRWNDGTEHTEGGFTNDVAVDGALISSSKCPSVGTNVRVEVLVPSPDNDTADIQIECEGKVVCILNTVGCRRFGVEGTFRLLNHLRGFVKDPRYECLSDS